MKTIVAVIFLVFVIIMGMSEIDKNRATFYANLSVATSSSSTSDSTSEDEETVSVTLSGEVTTPGTYSITKGYYLEEAITLAGGVTTNADMDCFSYYLEVEEDISIYIPATSEDTKVSLNEAELTDLKTLDGIGNTLGNRILTYRSENGEFTYLEQIMEVEGIGKSIFSKIKDDICL